jgi:hypothetical protein
MPNPHLHSSCSSRRADLDLAPPPSDRGRRRAPPISRLVGRRTPLVPRIRQSHPLAARPQVSHRFLPQIALAAAAYDERHRQPPSISFFRAPSDGTGRAALGAAAQRYCGGTCRGAPISRPARARFRPACRRAIMGSSNQAQ